MVEQANELILDILPLSAQTARLVRVYGTAPCVALPGTLPAPEGGSLALTELGDYCFSEKPRSLPAPDALCRYAVGADGAVRLTRAFGLAVGQNPAHVGGVGQAAGFHEHNVWCIRGRLLQRGLKLVQTAGAENRTVADLVQRRVQLPQQRAVHAGASEFVDDEPQPPAGKLPGKIFEEGGFPCTQKTGDEIQFHHIAPFLAEKRL